MSAFEKRREPIAVLENLKGELVHLRDRLFKLNTDLVKNYINDDMRDLRYKREKLIDKFNRIYPDTSAWLKCREAIDTIEEFMRIKKRTEDVVKEIQRLEAEKSSG